MYTIAQEIATICLNDTRIRKWAEGVYVLTMDAAIEMTGLVGGFLGIWEFHSYDPYLILTRFQTWKLPLFELMMQFPRPPHGLAVEAFSLAHMMGDPIDTLASLIFSLHCAQRRVTNLERNGMSRKRLLELVLLITSYEEYGDDENVVKLETLYASPALAPLSPT